MITRPDTASGRELYTVHCDTDGCTAALSAENLRGVARIERGLLRHDGAVRDYCHACVVRRGPAVIFPHPEHR